MIWSPTTRCLPLVFAILTIPLAPGTDARMFRANLEHTGTYAGPALQRFGRVKWKFHTNGRVISSPAVVSGLVYIGSTDGKLYAIDAGSGKQKWAFEAKARITSSPAVEGGAVYFESYDGNFYAVDAVSGQLRWKFQTAGERRFAGKNIHGILPAGEIMPDPFDSFLSSPAVWKGVVYFGSGDGSIYALDATSGSLKWKFPTGDVVHASPAVSNGMVFIGSWDRYMYALDASSGKEKWRFKTGEDRVIYNQVGIQSSASVVDGIVYFGCRDSNLYALNAVTGEKNWIFNNNGNWVITTPAVKGDTIYFATSDSALFYALDRRSGAVRFSLNMKWPMFSSPAVVDNMVYIGSREGKLFAIDVATQKVSWEFQSDTSRHNAAA
ncbi:MAG: PQQ-binding-like beta-propeller repeat protein, partial [Acidobacteria bacterium]|nr:PQQ-binding-like beta-propeller repeat protein [Acidobacteriota bacterium]